MYLYVSTGGVYEYGYSRGDIAPWTHTLDPQLGLSTPRWGEGLCCYVTITYYWIKDPQLEERTCPDREDCDVLI